MRILYIANVRMPTEKAHGIQIMKMLEAFSNFPAFAEASAGRQISKNIEIELIVPKRFNPIKADPFEYYGIDKNFRITYLPVLDLIWLGKFGFWLESISFLFFAFFYSLFRRIDIIYGRHEAALFLLSFFKNNIFLEFHDGKSDLLTRTSAKKAAGVITITAGLKDFYAKLGIPSEKILIAPDAVDINKFQIQDSKSQIREKLGLPQNKKIVLYSGHLYSWKGTDTLLETARMSDVNGQMSDVLFVFVGGTEEEIESYRSKVKDQGLGNVLFVGHRPYSEIPLWLKAADILVLPNSAKEEISRRFTSPLKLFEYMASGIPIIASGLPSIREVLREEESIFFEPDSSSDLFQKISYAFKNYENTRIKASSAFKKAINYTWEKRAQSIISFASKRLLPVKISDFWPAFFAGFIIAVLALPILKNLSALDFISRAAGSLFYVFLVSWILAVSFASVLGIYLARFFGARRPIVLQLARYGLIGWLNTFAYAGVFNFLSWLTDIASGLEADFLVFIAFVVAVTNSFFWNKYWVFEYKDSGKGHTEYAKFFGVTGFTALLNILIFHIVVNTIGVPAGLDEKLWANVAILIQIPVSFLGNFFGYKILVFLPR